MSGLMLWLCIKALIIFWVHILISCNLPFHQMLIRSWPFHHYVLKNKNKSNKVKFGQTTSGVRQRQSWEIVRFQLSVKKRVQRDDKEDMSTAWNLIFLWINEHLLVQFCSVVIWMAKVYTFVVKSPTSSSNEMNLKRNIAGAVQPHAMAAYHRKNCSNFGVRDTE